MFKIDDKIVCINTTHIHMANGAIDGIWHYLKRNKIYTITDIVDNGDRINLKGFNGICYLQDRFIPLTEFRKMKLDKLMKNE